MRITRREFMASAAAAALTARTAAARARRKLRVLIVDGVNNHDWRTATRGIREILTRTGRFEVEVSTTPPRQQWPADWALWKPEFARFDVVVNNFNGGETAEGLMWPAPVRADLENYVEHGGGLVIFHAANNAFLEWPAYNQMIGLGWREKSFGPGIRIGSNDEVILIPRGEGTGPGHAANLEFQVHVRRTHHPITNGMPPVWLHASDQLTHGQRGPAEDLTILTYATSPATHANEPMDWVRPYGKGRVYTTLLGHTWNGEGCPDFDCVGFQTILARGVEWAASGRVTQPIPLNFPLADTLSLSPLHLS